jgi:hypothetical protein
MRTTGLPLPIDWTEMWGSRSSAVAALAGGAECAGPDQFKVLAAQAARINAKTRMAILLS